VQNFLLAATDLGIDSVYIFGVISVPPTETELLKELGIPEGFKPVSSVALGYATEEAAAAPKVPRNIPVNRV
jgi:nitroreductase